MHRNLISCRTGFLGLLTFLAVVLLSLSSSRVKAAAGCCALPGDADGNGVVNLADVTLIVEYFFVGGAAPICPDQWDANGSGRLNIGDVTLLIKYTLYAGAPPVCPSEITNQERTIALNSVDSVTSLLDGVSPDSLATALVAFLNSRDEFEAVGQSGTSVWARFDDGRMVMIPNNRFPDTSIVASYPKGYEPSKNTVQLVAEPLPPRRNEENTMEENQSIRLLPAAPSYGLPHSVQSAVFSTLGANCFTLGQPYVNYLLDQGGYWISAVANPSPAELAGVQDFGFFYIDSHGGVCVSRNSTVITGIWTNTIFSDANDLVFKPQLDADELVYMYAKGDSGGTCKDQWRYAFTGKFVASYMSFAPNSFVYIGACESDAPSLKAGFTTAGASVFAGWTMPVTDPATNKASEFLVDRMLGTNLAVYTPKESPKQRPFDHAQLLQDMTSRGFDVDLNTGSELRITELNPGFGLLAPSLRFAYVINYTDTLFLTGYFGDDPGSKGHVYVDGVEQTVYDWQPTFIWASIPFEGAGSAGPITVEVEPLVGPSPSSGMKRKSNPINFTDWNGIFTYTMRDVGTLLGTIQFTAHFRADVHSFREAPHIAPATNSFIVFGGARNGFAYGEVSGQFEETFEYPDGTIEVVTTTWSGGIPSPPGVPVSGFDAVQNPYGTFLLQGKVDGHAKTMDLLLHATIGGQNAMTETVVSSLYGLQSVSEIYLSPPPQLYEGFPFPPVTTLFLSMDNGWAIIGGELNYTDNNDVIHKIIWPDIGATFTPDTTAAQ